MKPKVLPIEGNMKRTKKPTTKVHTNKYVRYMCGASSGSLEEPKDNNPNQFLRVAIIPLK
jgi:hypothetical protein